MTAMTDLPVPLPPLPEPDMQDVPAERWGQNIMHPALFVPMKLHVYAKSYARACMAPLQERVDALAIQVRQADERGDDALRRAHTAEERADALEAALSRLKAQEPVAFHWLVELFHRGGNSMGRYHTGLTDLHGASRSTVDVYQALRYTSKEAAQKAADKLNVMMKAAEWRAVEHGFHAAPPSQEQT